jgi:hypothetical protein
MITQTNKPDSFVSQSYRVKSKRGKQREERARERVMSVEQKEVAASVINSFIVEFLNDLLACAKHHK